MKKEMINLDRLDSKIRSYLRIIKNPRDYKLFSNFVWIQQNLKIKQAELSKTETTIPNLEGKLCFTLYLLYEFPEIYYDISRYRSVLNEFTRLIQKYQNQDSFYNNESTENDLLKKYRYRINWDQFLLFIENYYTDSPEQVEWEFFVTNNITTSKSLVIMQKLYQAKINLTDAFDELELNEEDWSSFNTHLKEYIHKILDDDFSPYPLRQIFITPTNIFLENKKLVQKYQQETLPLLKESIKNYVFLEKFSELIVLDYFTPNDLLYMNNKYKLYDSQNIKLRNNYHFKELVSFLANKILTISKRNPEDKKNYSALIQSSLYINSILRIFNIPHASEQFLLNLNLELDFNDPIEIVIFSVYLITLKYWLDILESHPTEDEKKKSNYHLFYPPQNINFEFPEKTAQFYITLKKAQLGELIQKCLENIGDSKKREHLNPIKEGLETVALMIYHKEYQKYREAMENDENKENLQKLKNLVVFPKIVIKLWKAQKTLFTEEEFEKITNNLLFLDKNKDSQIKGLIEYTHKKSKIKKKTERQDINNTILRACEYVFETVKKDVDNEYPYDAFGKGVNPETRIYVEVINSIKDFTKLKEIYSKKLKKLNGSIKNLVIIVGSREFTDDEKFVSDDKGKVVFIDDIYDR